MKLQSILAVTSLAGLAQCVTMAGYSPGAGVEAEFKTFLQALYATAETPSATTTFSNFFTSNGRLIVLSNTATGAQQIIALKQRLLPPAGNKHWNHRPGSTTVSSENGAQKTYLVVGEIQTTFDGGNCSKASYQTRFSLTKNSGFKPQSMNLIAYDDFVVNPATTPTNIPCTY